MIRPVPSRNVVITGRGAVSSLGADCRSLWESVSAGHCGIREITRFDTSQFSVSTGAQAVSEALVAAPVCTGVVTPLVSESLCLALAVRALREALREAGLWDEAAGVASRRNIAFVFGTGLGELTRPLALLTDDLATASGLDGIRLTVSTACSSSTAAIGLGLELLAMRSADIVVAGGADVLTPEVFAGFHALGVLTRTRCAPFSMPAGTTLGEGAGFFVLETETGARERAAVSLGMLAGYGLSCDAWHETSPDPKGGGIERAILAAAADAGIDPSSFDYVNAHGSGTQANDSAEWFGIRRALGAGADLVPVSSTKGALGHAQGAAGVLEAIVTLESMRQGLIPPTLNFALPRPNTPPDPVASIVPRAWTVDRALSVNSAFGGANAAIVITRTPTRRLEHPRRALLLSGIGAVDSIRFGQLEQTDWTAPFPIDELRRGDPSSRALIAAAVCALHDAAYRCTGERRNRTGLFVGQRRPSPASTGAFLDSIATNGLPQLSASAFARTVLNAAAGTCARLLSLRGPHTVVTTGAASGLTALILAAEHLVRRPALDAMLAGSVDERPLDSPLSDDIDDAAHCVVLCADHRDATAARVDVRLVGWGLAEPAATDRAIEVAFEMAGFDGVPPGTAQFETGEPAHGACASMIPLAAAVGALRAGACEHAVVSCTASGALSAALVLSR